jgi:hypothetical protein
MLRALFSKRACASWRYVGFEGHSHPNPEDCSRCWLPCQNVLSRERWSAGVRRCEECVQSLVHCPLPAVRKALVDETNVSEDVLRALVTDPNGPVSMKARRKLDFIEAERASVAGVGTGAIRLGMAGFETRRQRRAAVEVLPPTASPSIWENTR